MPPQALVRRQVASTVATVASVHQLTPRMRRIRLFGEGIAAVPGQTIKIYVPDPDSGHQVTREYTVRDYHVEKPGMDVDFVLHGDGAAANWARRVQPGEPLEFVGPSGRYRPDPQADWHLYAGDETALPAIQAYVEMLPANACVMVYVEVADAADEQPMPGAAKPTVRWLHRDGRPPGACTLLDDAVRAARLPSGQGRIWLAGHTPAVRRIRTHLLTERDVDRRALYVKGFWDRQSTR